MEGRMTREETIKVLMVMQAAYPNYKPEDKTVAVNVWMEMLGDIPYEQVSTALKAYIQTDKSGFAPVIGDIREKAQILFGEDVEINENEAWSLVLKAVQRSGYYSEEEFAKLPKIIQRAIGSPSRLREMALDEKFNHGVESSNFQNKFRIEQQKEREKQRLSPDVSMLIREKEISQIRQDKTPSIEEQRMLAEENAKPAPDDFKEKLFSVLGEMD